VSGFKGHGVAIDGDSGSLPDRANLTRVAAFNNGGYGIFLWGTDANVATIIDYDIFQNVLGGWRGDTFYGNAWVGGHTRGNNTGNGGNVFNAGSNQALTSISVSGGVCTATLTSAFTGSIGTVGTWIAVIGTSSGSGFNSATYTPTRGQPASNIFYTGSAHSTGALIAARVTSANSGAKTLTYNCGASGGPATGGNIRTASSDEVVAYYGNGGIRQGSMVSSRSSNWIANGYLEGDQPYPDCSGGCLADGGTFYFGDYAQFQGTRITDNGPGVGEFTRVDSKGFQHWLRSGGILSVVDQATSTVKWSVDNSGNQASVGTLCLGTNSLCSNPTIVALSVTNNTGIYSKTSGGGNWILMYPRSTDILEIGQAANTTKVMGPLAVGASGSTISDSRELVQSLHDCGATTTCANTANQSMRMITGRATLAAGTATVTGITTFTSTSTFNCWANDFTTATNLANAKPASATSITVTGTGTDVISYMCVGN
jgi:hypothetical protein